MTRKKEKPSFVIAIYNVGDADYESPDNFIGFLRPNYNKKPYPLTDKLRLAMTVQTEKLGHKRGKAAVKFLFKRNRQRPFVEPNYFPMYEVRKLTPIRY